jgi:hypothetical protein
MAIVDLHNFFKYYDEKNPNHVKAVQWLEDNLPVKYLDDNMEWADIYRGKKSTPVAPAPVSSGSVCPHCGKPLGK